MAYLKDKIRTPCIHAWVGYNTKFAVRDNLASIASIAIIVALIMHYTDDTVA